MVSLDADAPWVARLAAAGRAEGLEGELGAEVAPEQLILLDASRTRLAAADPAHATEIARMLTFYFRCPRTPRLAYVQGMNEVFAVFALQF